MSLTSDGKNPGIQFGREEVGESDEHGRRTMSITLDVLDRVQKTTWDMDSLNWCGGQKFHIGSLAQAKALYEHLGRQLERLEQSAASGKAVYK